MWECIRIVISSNSLSGHPVAYWNLAWGLIMFHVSKDNIYFLCVFDLKEQGKGFYQSQSDQCNPIKKINAPSTLHFSKRGTSPSLWITRSKALGAALTWPQTVRSVTPGWTFSRGWPASAGSSKGAQSLCTVGRAAPGDIRACRSLPWPSQTSGGGSSSCLPSL